MLKFAYDVGSLSFAIMSNKEIIPIDSVVLIQQHGSIHCITMQYPEL